LSPGKPRESGCTYAVLSRPHTIISVEEEAPARAFHRLYLLRHDKWTNSAQQLLEAMNGMAKYKKHSSSGHGSMTRVSCFFAHLSTIHQLSIFGQHGEATQKFLALTVLLCSSTFLLLRQPSLPDCSPMSLSPVIAFFQRRATEFDSTPSST